MSTKAHRYTGLFVTLLAGAVFAVSAGAQDIRSSLFRDTDALLQRARDAQVELLSPGHYADAMSAYSKAEKEVAKGRADKAQEALKDVNTSLTKGLEASNIATTTFDATLKARTAAVAADAESNASELWASAEKEFSSATRTLERGSVGPAQKSAGKATGLYDQAELTAITNATVGNARQLISEAEDVDADRYAPVTFGKAESLVAEAEAELAQDRYATAGPQMKASEAEYEARHAAYLTSQAKALKGKDKSPEELILEWEQPLASVSGALGTTTDLSAGYAAAGAAATAKATEVVAKNEEMASRLTELELALGSTEQVVEQTQRLERELKEVENLLGPGQAVVLRQGNDLIMRLIGLSFPVGQATIQTEYYGLLRQVQKAIAIYEVSPIVVEGHTDSQGSDQANLRLSQQRADAVREYLIANLGLDAGRITAIGYGEDRPISSNETTAGRAENRRIDIVIKNARGRKD